MPSLYRQKVPAPVASAAVSRDEQRIEIEPEPTPAERAAILAALEAARSGDVGVVPGAWWEAGLREEEDPG
jgi:hypothetical protein